jgi:hypothetical protein
VDLRWQNTAGSGARFRIYQAWTGEEVSGTPVCGSVKGEAKMLYETPEGWTSIYLEVGDMVIGNGAPCYWISAVQLGRRLNPPLSAPFGGRAGVGCPGGGDHPSGRRPDRALRCSHRINAHER